MEYKMIDDVTRFLRGIPLREFGPQGAFDAAISKGRARDEEGGQPSAIAGMIALRDKMSPEGFKALCMSLCDEDGAEDGDPASQFSSPEAHEKPEAQRAQDRKAKGAMDMAFDGPPRRKSSGEKSFAAMYGDAALSIKTNSDPYPIASRTRA
jgi:hypothetical protein